MSDVLADGRHDLSEVDDGAGGGAVFARRPVLLPLELVSQLVVKVVAAAVAVPRAHRDVERFVRDGVLARRRPMLGGAGRA